MSESDRNRPDIENCGCDFCGEPVAERMRIADRGGVSRRGLLLGGSGLIGAGLLGAGVAAPRRAVAQAGTGLPDRGEFVIRDGVVVTVDDTLGTLYGADVHVRNGEIIAVGENLEVPASAEEIDASRMIVMPGLIDTHFHIWTSLMRNMLSPGNEYFAIKRAFVPNMTPDAFYASDMLAFAESINAGVTTLHNYDHHCMNRDTVEAEMRAHADSGVRSLFTFGHPDGLPAEQTIDLDLAEAIRTQYFGGASPFEGLVTMGLNTRGHGNLSEEIYRAEADYAFSHGMMFAMHGGQGRRNWDLQPLKDWGYLGPKTLLVHMVHATAGDRALMAETGAPLSYSIQSEMRLGSAGNQSEQLVHMFNDGVTVSFSFDTNSLAQIDMFETMANAWYMGIPHNGTSTEGLTPLNFEDVIRMGTINGAKALGLDTVTGSLTPGKRADIILLRADDLNLVPFGFVEGMIGRTARASNVDTVIIDGRIMKRGGTITGLDVGHITEEVARVAHDARVAIGDIYAPDSDSVPSY